MDNNAPSILRPTVIGGVSAAVVSSIPVVACLNVFCCALVVGGGFLAGYLYSKECGKQGFAFGPANGATVGLVAGLFYALTDSVITGLIHALGWAPDLEQVLTQMDEAGLPPEYADQMVWAIEKFGTGFSIFHFLLTWYDAAAARVPDGRPGRFRTAAATASVGTVASVRGRTDTTVRRWTISRE